MSFKPLGDRVLVRPIQEEEETESGIIIPETAKEKPQKGVVEAVGPGKITEAGDKLPMNVKEGDNVLFGKYAGDEIQLDGDDFLIMHETDILGIVE
ncbi:MAG: co-chaperone GroES [Elusimicrobiota bacterium]